MNSRLFPTLSSIRFSGSCFMLRLFWAFWNWVLGSDKDACIWIPQHTAMISSVSFFNVLKFFQHNIFIDSLQIIKFYHVSLLLACLFYIIWCYFKRNCYSISFSVCLYERQYWFSWVNIIYLATLLKVFISIGVSWRGLLWILYIMYYLLQIKRLSSFSCLTALVKTFQLL